MKEILKHPGCISCVAMKKRKENAKGTAHVGFLWGVNISTGYIKINGELCTFPQQGGEKALIDYIIINKKRKNNALNFEASNNFCMTKYDNQIVSVKFGLNLRTNEDEK